LHQPSEYDAKQTTKQTTIMSISRILSECPNVQMGLGELFIEVGQREQLPFLEYLLSPENAKMIRTEVSPGNGKLKTVQARWIQRLPETEVEEGGNILTCSSENTYGDSTKTYTVEATDTYTASQLINAADIARHCQENSRYVLESIMRLMDVLDRKIASVAAAQAVAEIGSWGTDATGFFPTDGDCIEVATIGASGEVNPFALADITQAAQMANYPAAPIAFGGAAMQRYANAVKAGCCTNTGIDLLAISQQNGFGFAYDARIASAFGDQTHALVTTAGAIQWLSFNLAEWNAGITPTAGSNYSKTLVYTPAGVPVDLTMKDDCGNLSIVLTTTGIVAALPTDIYEASDKFAGVNYVNCVSIVNPA
jgi:hypothetical protein